MPMKMGALDGLRDVMVGLLDQIRRQALQEGLSPLKQYDQISSRMQIAARTAGSMGAWATEVLRRLQVAAPSSSVSSELLRVEAAVDVVARESGMHPADVVAVVLDTVTAEHGWYIAKLREAAEARKKLAEEKRAIERGGAL